MKYKIQRNVGKAKYLLSYYNGINQHKDGSEFWGIKIFRSKKKLDSFIKNKLNYEVEDKLKDLTTQMQMLQSLIRVYVTDKDVLNKLKQYFI